MYERIFASLHATSLTPEQHERTCGYWYTVTNAAMSHTAFATRRGLDRWLEERGLKLKAGLPSQGTFGATEIIGAYGDRSYLEDWEDFERLHPVIATAVTSNGDYTLALITEDKPGGFRTVHYLNPNVKGRIVFDCQRTRELMS